MPDKESDCGLVSQLTPWFHNLLQRKVADKRGRQISTPKSEHDPQFHRL